MSLQVTMSGNDVSSDYPVNSQTRGLTHNESTGKHKVALAFLIDFLHQRMIQNTMSTNLSVLVQAQRKEEPTGRLLCLTATLLPT